MLHSFSFFGPFLFLFVFLLPTESRSLYHIELYRIQQRLARSTSCPVVLPWKAPLRYSQTAQIQSKPRDPSKCVSTSVCTGTERDYGEAFTLSGQRDGSAPSLAPPIPDHRPGISGLLSHNESTALTLLPPPVN